MATICMKYQILFSGKNKKNIMSLLSAELAQRVMKVNQCNMVYKVNSKYWTGRVIFCLKGLDTACRFFDIFDKGDNF